MVGQVSAQMMLWHPTYVQQLHRVEMTLQAIMDHLHLGIVMFVGAARTVLTMPSSASRPMSMMPSCGTTPGCLFKSQIEKGHNHSGFGTHALQTLGAAALAECLPRQVIKSREFFCWVLFVAESVERVRCAVE